MVWIISFLDTLLGRFQCMEADGLLQIHFRAEIERHLLSLILGSPAIRVGPFNYLDLSLSDTGKPSYHFVCG
jgi:hypothetical protein